MINLNDVPDGIKEPERAARLGLSGAMIAEYPHEERRYDQPEYERFWAAAAAHVFEAPLGGDRLGAANRAPAFEIRPIPERI